MVTPHVSFQIPVVLCQAGSSRGGKHCLYRPGRLSSLFLFLPFCIFVQMGTFVSVPRASSPEPGHRKSPRRTVAVDKVMCSVLFLMLQFVKHITKVCPHGVIKGTAISLRLGSQTEKC